MGLYVSIKNTLGESNNITLWVLGHQGIPGNEEDRFAEARMEDSSDQIVIPFTVGKKVIRRKSIWPDERPVKEMKSQVGYDYIHMD